MEANMPGTAPELPKGKPAEHDEVVEREETPAAPTPQLIKSTASTLQDPEPADETDEDDELNEHVNDPGDPDGVHAAEEEEKQLPAPRVPIESARPRKPKRRWPLVVLVVLLLAGAVVGTYWFGLRKPSTPPASKSTPTSHATKKTTQPAIVPTKHYDSDTYTLGFDYPQTWDVSDTAAKLTVTSPAASLTTVDGKTVDAHVLVTFQNPQTTIAGYPTTGAIASLASDKLTYKQPTSVQRAQTYLSYLGYASASSLDALYVTGDNGYQQGQQIPMSDVVKGNPLISVTFVTCGTTGCGAAATAVTVQADAWKSSVLSQQVTNLLQSIQLN